MKEVNNKKFKRKLEFYKRILVYCLYLTLLSYSFWVISFELIHRNVGENHLYAYLGNILLTYGVLFEDKASNKVLELWYKKLRKETWFKKGLKKHLASKRHRPSMKTALYFYIKLARKPLPSYGVDESPMVLKIQY